MTKLSGGSLQQMPDGSLVITTTITEAGVEWIARGRRDLIDQAGRDLVDLISEAIDSIEKVPA